MANISLVYIIKYKRYICDFDIKSKYQFLFRMPHWLYDVVVRRWRDPHIPAAARYVHFYVMLYVIVII